MARIPTYQRSVVTPGAQNIRVPQGAFDPGISGLVAGAQKGLDGLQKMQEEDDARAAMNAYAAASDKVRALTLDPENGIYAKRGGDALGTYKAGEAGLGSIYAETTAALKSDRQRQAFDVLWAQRRETELNSIARHEAQERRTYRDQTGEALVKSAVVDAASNYTNPEAVAQSLRTAEVAIRANNAGEPPDLVSYKVASARSAIHAGVVERMMIDSATRAKAYLDANRKEIDGLTSLKLDKALVGGLTKERAEAFVSSLSDVGPADASIASQAAAQGVDPVVALTIARLENASGDPNARPIGADGKAMSSAHGMFQMIDGTWAARGGKPEERGDPAKQIELGVKNLAEESAALEKTLGRKPEGWEVYLAHQQGAGGARKILAGDAGANAVAALGHDAVLNNGGSADMTVGQFRDVWKAKYERAAARVKIPGDPVQDRAIESGASLAEKLARADAIEDPEVRKHARALLLRDNALAQTALDAQDRAYREMAWRAMGEGGSTRDIPPSVWGFLDTQTKDGLLRFEERQAKGNDTTDPTVYYKLSKMAGEDPQTFVSQDLLLYRDKLSESDWKGMADMQRVMIAGGRKAATAITSVRGANEMVDDALRAIGVDMTPKEGSADAKTAALFHRRVQENIAALEAQKGSKATPGEIQGVIDWQLMRGRSESASMYDKLFGRQRAFEARAGDTFVVTDIDSVPPAEVKKITEALRRAGRAPTDSVVLQLFNMRLREGRPVDVGPAAGARTMQDVEDATSPEATLGVP